MALLYIVGILILVTLGTIIISIVLKWILKQDKKYINININEWKDMNIINMDLKKKKAILEREIIQLILDDELYDEELPEEDIYQ